MGVSTVDEGLDELFYIVTTNKNWKLVKQTLESILAYSIFNITGVSDTGKSLITVEAPVNFLFAGLKLRLKVYTAGAIICLAHKELKEEILEQEKFLN